MKNIIYAGMLFIGKQECKKLKPISTCRHEIHEYFNPKKQIKKDFTNETPK